MASSTNRRRRMAILAIGFCVLFALVLLGVGAVAYRRLAPGGPPQTNVQSPAPPLQASSDPARGDIRFVQSGEVVAGPEVEVEVVAPTGASEMQIGLDPTFATVAWVPIEAQAVLSVPDVGYQMLFARFRAGPGAEPTEVSVDGITIDPHYEAATSSADGLHRASWVRPLSSRSVMVRVEAGRVERGTQIPYDFDAAPEGDDVSGLFGPKNVERDGLAFGRQVRGTDGLLRIYDRLVGKPLDGPALASGPWSLVGGDRALSPTAINRISRASNNGLGDGGERFTPLIHDVILEFDAELEPGVQYRLEPPSDLVEAVDFVFDPTSTISPSVHVNQNGYGPNDALKVGYLSGPINDYGSPGYVGGTPFRVVETASGGVALEGSTVARPGGDELGQGDLTGAPTFEMDFSALTEPGRYRLCVDGVGCSEEFELAERVWDDLVVSVGRAMYHQRSGVALGPPYTSVERPRPYHPDDGMVIVESSYRLLDASQAPLDQLFIDLAAGGSEVEVPDAWGGHFDAGDWDRRIEHLYFARAVIELVEMDPERYLAMELGIPESGNPLPDLLDEGLWTLDLFRRLQRADGAIPGGIEASEHPQPDATSWSDTLSVFAFEPDPWTSYFYAGVAAQASAVVRSYDPDLADVYLSSALSAMTWAEAQPAESLYTEEIRLHRSLAAVSLLKATGDESWHDVFTETTTLADGVDGFLACNEHGACDAGWIYLSIDPSLTDPALRELIEQSFVATGDGIVAAAEETAFGWALEDRFIPLIWGFGVGGSPNAIGLMRAYELTGDERYLATAQRSAAVSLGANPLNTVYITGVGRNPVRNPLIVDTLNGGLPVWPGTPVYGNHQLNSFGNEGWIEEFMLEPAGVDPLPTELPYLWQWQDVPDVPMFNEYTVFQSHGEALYAFGLLARASSTPG